MVSNGDSPLRPGSGPWAHFITFSCYGSRIHGDPAGSIDRDHNLWKSPLLSQDPRRESKERGLMSDPGYCLAETDRRIVLSVLKEHCRFRGWVLHAAYVRRTHVHLVVASEEKAESILGQLKSYASRALNRADGVRRKRWSNHGSTRYLWSARAVDDAVGYVVAQEGAPMAVYVNPRRWREGFKS